MKFSKTILSVAVAAAMVGAAGHVFAQAPNRDGTSAGSNNPNNNPMNSSGAMGGTDNRVSGAPGTMDSSGRMSNDTRNMSNRRMRDDGTGAVGQSSSGAAGERLARADRN